jgi:hypothetical protein
MPENKSALPLKPNRKWYTLFSLLLWTQLIFSGGLTLWRYQLVLTQDWPVYPSNNSPRLDPFATFIKSICSDSEGIGYISTEYNSFTRLKYELYPRPFHNLSDLTETELQPAIEASEIHCLVYDFAPNTRLMVGTLHDFSSNQFVLRLEAGE